MLCNTQPVSRTVLSTVHMYRTRAPKRESFANQLTSNAQHMIDSIGKRISRGIRRQVAGGSRRRGRRARCGGRGRAPPARARRAPGGTRSSPRSPQSGRATGKQSKAKYEYLYTRITRLYTVYKREQEYE